MPHRIHCICIATLIVLVTAALLAGCGGSGAGSTDPVICNPTTLECADHGATMGRRGGFGIYLGPDQLLWNGQYLYARCGSQLAVLDASDLADPQWLSWTGGFITHCDLSLDDTHQFGFQVDIDGLRSFSLADPEAPELIGQASYDPGHLTVRVRLALHGTHALALTSNGVLHVFDVSVPAAPFYVTSVATPDGATFHYLAVVGNTAYVGDSDGGSYAIDVTDPINPVLLDMEVPFVVGSDTVQDGDRLYVYNRGPMMDQWEIWDAADPSDLTLLGATDWYYGSLLVDGDLAYFYNENYVTVYDVADPAEVTVVGRFWSYRSRSYGAVKDGALALLSTDQLDDVINFFDVSTTETFLPTAEFEFDLDYDSIFGGDLARDETRLFVADHNQGLQVVDITEPTCPIHTATLDLPAGDPAHLCLDGTLLYAAHAEGLSIFDVAPAVPVLMGSYASYGALIDVVASGSQVLLLTEDGVLSVAALEDDQLRLQGSLDLDEECRSMVVVGTSVLVAIDDVLLVVDIADPQNPVRAGRHITPDDPGDMAFVGDLLVVQHRGGLQFLDVSSPTSPVVVDDEQIFAESLNVGVPSLTIVEPLVYLVTSNGLAVFDALSGDEPRFVGSIQSPKREDSMFLEHVRCAIATEEAVYLHWSNTLAIYSPHCAD